MNPENPPTPKSSNQPQSSFKPLRYKVFLILLAVVIVADLYVLYLICSSIFEAYFGCPGSIGGGECGWYYFAAILEAAYFGFPLALITCAVLFGFFKSKPSDKAK